MNEQKADRYACYLKDLGTLIKESALEAKEIAGNEEPGSDAFHLEAERLMAFNEVISIMQQQARGFLMTLEELDLHDIKPDQDLV